jgi:hypothetical protein
MDGPFILNGAFTGALLQTWSKGSFKGSYNALAKAVSRQLPPSQSPNYMTLAGGMTRLSKAKPSPLDGCRQAGGGPASMENFR